MGGAHGPLQILVDGWNASGILTEQAGFPLAMHAPVVDGGNRPNIVPGADAKLSSSRPITAKVAEWFNTSAFSLPVPFTFGNVSRTIGYVRAPGIHNLDFTMEKGLYPTNWESARFTRVF